MLSMEAKPKLRLLMPRLGLALLPPLLEDATRSFEVELRPRPRTRRAFLWHDAEIRSPLSANRAIIVKYT